MLFPFWQQFSSYFDPQPGFPTGAAMFAIVSEHLIVSLKVEEVYLKRKSVWTVMYQSLEKASYQLEAMSGDSTRMLT